MTGTLASYTIMLKGKPVTYSVRYSRTAKRNRIQVNSEGVTVFLPRQVSEDQAALFLIQNEAWVVEQIAFINRMGSMRIPQPELPPDTFLFRGVQTHLNIIPVETDRTYGLVDEQPGKLNIHIPQHGNVNNQKTIETWLRRQARMDIEERIKVRSEEMKQNPGRIYIMDQKTKWGGCSGRQNLSFNWRLVMAPKEVLDYIVVHELAHLIESKHTTLFWLIVRSYCPDFEHHKAWLRDNRDMLYPSLFKNLKGAL